MPKILRPEQTNEIIELLKAGKIGVLPTDTIYGLHCDALDTKLIAKVHALKKKPENMPLITIISNPKDLDLFNVTVGGFEKELISKCWPGPNTLIFKLPSGEFRSFRLPDSEFLQAILPKTGPLISTSANYHDKPFAKNITEAIDYFGDEVDFYVDAGELNNPPSSVYRIDGTEVLKLR